MKTYCAYFRTSTDSHKAGKSKSKGLGLQAQQLIVRHYAKDNLVKEFTEIKSAKNISDRPVLKEAIDYCIQNNCWLIVAKLDRLSRNVDDVRLVHQQLNKKITFCDIPSDGETDLFTITLFAAFAERERELISLRTSQALKAKIEKEGKWQKPSDLILSGELAMRAKKANKEKALNNENTIRAREVITSRLKEGLSYSEIAEILNGSKHRTPAGKEFRATQVQRIAQPQK